MSIFDTELPNENSGKVSQNSTFEGTSAAINAMSARRKKRLHRVQPFVGSFRAHGLSFLTRDSRKAGFNVLRGRPCGALNPSSDRLKIHRQQRKSAIPLKRLSFSSGYLCFSPMTAAYQHVVNGTHATLSDGKAGSTFNPILKREESHRENFFGDIHPLTSYSVAEDFWAGFFDIPVKGVNNSRSKNTPDASMLLRDPRVIGPEPDSTVLIPGSNRTGTFQNLNFYLEPSSISGSGFSIDAAENFWVREDTIGVGPADSNSLLGNRHGSKFVCDEGTLAKAKLVNSLIETVCRYFVGEPKSLAALSSTSDPVISESDRSKYGSSTNISKGSKRSRTVQERRDEDDDRNDGERGLKRPKSFLLDSEDTNRKFACPYRKHNPQKYSVRQWRSCALTPLDTIARVKAHLYRHHRIFQCQRCKVLFPSQEDVNTHLMAARACEISNAEPIDGLTSDIVERLKSRRKPYPGQSEEERWREVYRLLFPDELIPTPYFEPVQENEESKSGSLAEDLGAYEQYARHELPRLVRAALEEAITGSTQPLEEVLRHQLVTIIRSAHDRVFASYRATINLADEPVTTTSRSEPRYHTSELSEQTPSTISISTPPEIFFPPPPPLAGNIYTLPTFDGVDKTVDLHAENSDSAYMSEKSTEPKRNGVEEQIQSSTRSVKDSDTSSFGRPDTTAYHNFETRDMRVEPHGISPDQHVN